MAGGKGALHRSSFITLDVDIFTSSAVIAFKIPQALCEIT